MNNRIEAFEIAHGESCFVISNEMRVAMLKLLGGTSRDDRARIGLTDDQNTLAEQLYWLLQT